MRFIDGHFVLEERDAEFLGAQAIPQRFELFFRAEVVGPGGVVMIERLLDAAFKGPGVPGQGGRLGVREQTFGSGGVRLGAADLAELEVNAGEQKTAVNRLGGQDRGGEEAERRAAMRSPACARRRAA